MFNRRARARVFLHACTLQGVARLGLELCDAIVSIAPLLQGSLPHLLPSASRVSGASGEADVAGQSIGKGARDTVPHAHV